MATDPASSHGGEEDAGPAAPGTRAAAEKAARRALLAEHVALACDCIRRSTIESVTRLDPATLLLRCRIAHGEAEPTGLRWWVLVLRDGVPFRSRVFASEYEARETHHLYGQALGPACTEAEPWACHAYPVACRPRRQAGPR